MFSGKKNLNLEPLTKFVKHLLKEKGLDSLELETKTIITEDLINRLHSVIISNIVASIPKNKLKEFDKLIDKGDKDEIQAFYNNNIRGFQSLVTKTLTDFKTNYLGIDEFK